jgi:nitroreductase
MKKAIFTFVILFALTAAFLPAQSADNPALRTIINHFSARNYAPESISKAELDLIIQAGIRAPSAGNRQPWHFTVVQDFALARRILSATTEGNVLIVVSSVGENRTSNAVILDCALAVQSMYLAAQALGLGSRIYTNPVNTINERFKTDLGLTDNHHVMSVIRIGRLSGGVDAVSSASPRSNAEQKVNYK